MISDDEFLERLVAAMCVATAKDVEVLWNYNVNGRQFDVALFFQNGPFKYSTLIEVKNRKRKIDVTDVEAFVTKAKDHHANKIAFFSSAGFQSGCKEVAARHSVDLFRISFSNEPPSPAVIKDRLRYSFQFSLGGKIKSDEPPTVAIGEKQKVIAIPRIVLTYVDGTQCVLPEEPTEAEYVGAKSMLGSHTLKVVINGLNLTSPRLNEEQRLVHEFRPPLRLNPPEFFLKAGMVRQIDVTYSLQEGYSLISNCLVEPTLFASDVHIENILTGEVAARPFHDLRLGLGKFVSGEYYCTYAPLAYYYCEWVGTEFAKLYVVESFQFGQLFQAQLRVPIDEQGRYLLVQDKVVIERLATRLKKLRTD